MSEKWKPQKWDEPVDQTWWAVIREDGRHTHHETEEEATNRYNFDLKHAIYSCHDEPMRVVEVRMVEADHLARLERLAVACVVEREFQVPFGIDLANLFDGDYTAVVGELDAGLDACIEHNDIPGVSDVPR